MMPVCPSLAFPPVALEVHAWSWIVFLQLIIHNGKLQLRSPLHFFLIDEGKKPESNCFLVGAIATTKQVPRALYTTIRVPNSQKKKIAPSYALNETQVKRECSSFQFGPFSP